MTSFLGGRKLWALMAGAAVWSGAAAAPTRALDIVGISIGTTEADAIKALKKHNAAMKIKQPDPVVFEALPSTPMRFWLMGLAQSDGGYTDDTVTVTFSGAPGPSRVVAVARSLYASTKPFSLSALLSGLRKKYGPETEYRPVNGSGSGGIAWLFDENGNPLRFGGKSAISECGQVSQALGQLKQQYRPYQNATMLSQLKPACGTMIVGQFDNVMTGNADLISGFTLTLLSNPGWKKSADDLLAYLDAADARLQKQKEKEAAARGAPQL